MIIVTINREELVAAKACGEGIALFDKLKIEQDSLRVKEGKLPRKSVRIRWTRLSQVWLAVIYPWVWSWMRDEGLMPSVPLRWADLSSADLSSADLSSADLRWADLRWANLSSADLSSADLSSADLGNWERGPDGYARRKVK